MCRLDIKYNRVVCVTIETPKSKIEASSLDFDSPVAIFTKKDIRIHENLKWISKGFFHLIVEKKIVLFSK